MTTVTRSGRGRLAAWVLLLAAAVAGCGPGRDGADPPTAAIAAPDATTLAVAGGTDVSAATAAAETLCPVMWTWVKDVGAVFNAASRDTMDIAGADERRTRWLEALDEMGRLNTRLGAAVASMDLGPAGPLAGDVAAGLEGSNGVLDELRTLIADTPEIDEGRPQARTAQLIVRIEKVIDLPKPRLAPYEDPGLTAGFVAVPACQHSVKDANDGQPRANG